MIMNKRFVYYSEKFSDGGTIDVYLTSEDVSKHSSKNGIYLFSDNELREFLRTYRKTSFMIGTPEPASVEEVKRLASLFNLQALVPVNLEN